MARVLLPSGQGSLMSSDQMFERILHKGNWDGALKHMTDLGEDGKKWAVLVTGVNGIQKTNAMYQPWFSNVLQEALIAPTLAKEKKKEFKLEVLPNGHNSFFRQLDHMITTLCNEDFSKLYALTSAQLDHTTKNDIDSLTTKRRGRSMPILPRNSSNGTPTSRRAYSRTTEPSPNSLASSFSRRPRTPTSTPCAKHPAEILQCSTT